MNERPLFEIAQHSVVIDGLDSQDWLPIGRASVAGSSSAHLDGDTWHPTLEEAFAQAAQQFGTLAGQWKRVGG